MSTTHLGLQTTNTYFIFMSFRYTPTMLPVSQVSETQKTGVLLRAPWTLFSFCQDSWEPWWIIQTNYKNPSVTVRTNLRGGGRKGQFTSELTHEWVVQIKSWPDTKYTNLENQVIGSHSVRMNSSGTHEIFQKFTVPINRLNTLTYPRRCFQRLFRITFTLPLSFYYSLTLISLICSSQTKTMAYPYGVVYMGFSKYPATCARCTQIQTLLAASSESKRRNT